MTAAASARGHGFTLAAQRVLRRFLWIGASIALSCGPVTETVGSDVASVELTPPTSTIMVGAQLPLRASVQDAEGRAIAGASIFWSVRDPNIASVSPEGIVTGLAVGSTQVAASVGGHSAIAAITVLRVPVAAVVVQPKSAEISAGGRVQFTASVQDANQVALSGRSITWTSSNEELATVNATGLVSALAAGVVTIAATSEGKTDAATLTITRAAVATVAVTPDPLAMSVGQTTQLTATARDAAGISLPGRTATWTSSNTNVATVSDQGVANAIGVGTTTITASVEGKSGSATLTVTNFPVGSVSIAPSNSTLTPGGSVQLTATVRDVTGAVAANRPVAWSSSNTAVATVSPSGLVTAVAVGSASITATSEGQSGVATVTVVAASVSSIEVSPPAVTLGVQQTVALSVTLKDPDGFVLTGRSVTFNSNNSAIAAVSAAGVVTGVAPGTTAIVVASEGKSANVPTSVTAAAVGSVVVQPATVSLAPGQTTTLSATVRDATGAVVTDRPVSWATTNATVAAVSSTGVVTGVALGTATITATSDGKVGSATVTVAAASVASVQVEPSTASVTVGQTTTLTATTRDANGGVLTGRTVTWSTSSASIATVSTSGGVTGVAPGTATITATSEGKSGSATVTVNAVPVAPVATVTVSPSTVSIIQGGTSTLTATAKDANGNTLSGRSIAWTTSAQGVATVSASGVVTAVAPGTATITATSEGKSGTALVTVTASPVGSVTVQPATTSVVSGSTTTLTATVRDQNGAVVTNRTVTWTSSNPAVATVSSAGVVTGVLVGTATITATAEGKSGTSAVTVTVGPIATVRVSPATISIASGATTTLTAQAVDAAGNPISGVTFAWSSSDSSIANVTGDGRVTGKKEGTVTIAATAAGKIGTATVTVTR